MYGLPDTDAPYSDPAMTGFASGPETGFAKNWLTVTRDNELLNPTIAGVGGFMQPDLEDQRQQWKAATGESVPVYSSDARVLDPNYKTPAPVDMMIDAKIGSPPPAEDSILQEQAFQKKVDAYNQQNPNNPINSFSNIYNRAKSTIADTQSEESDVRNRSTALGDIGAFLGGISAQGRDPVMGASMVATAPFMGVGETMLARMGTEGLVNSGVSLFNDAAVHNPLQRKYNEQTLSSGEMAQNAVGAFALGAGMRGAAEGLPILAGKGKQIYNNLREDSSPLAGDLLKARTPDEAASALRGVAPEEISNLIDRVDPSPTTETETNQAIAAHEILADEMRPEDMDWQQHMENSQHTIDSINNYSDEIPLAPEDEKAFDEWQKYAANREPDVQPTFEQPTIRNEADADKLLENEFGANPDNIVPLGEVGLDENGRMTNEKMTVQKMAEDLAQDRNLIEAMNTCMRNI